MVEFNCKHCHNPNRIELGDKLYVDTGVYQIYGIEYEHSEGNEYTIAFTVKKDTRIRLVRHEYTTTSPVE